MKISQKWLSEFVEIDPDSWPPERISDVLTDLGLEVEHIEDQQAMFNRFVIGVVKECEKHPKADKLSVTQVDVGEDELRTIVCGAPNVAAGQTVIVALDGAVIPGADFTIGKRKLRGVESNGMICSEAELKNGEGDASGIMVLDEGTPGLPLTDAMGWDDVIYDVALTPNRADCASHVGVARDLAAFMEIHEPTSTSRIVGRVPQSREQTTESSQNAVTAEVDDADLCPRYALQRITGVKVGPSPEWMQQRLRALGLRPRNILVDVTNYVNMELGQPLHAFDYNKLRGGGIVVKVAKKDEKFVTLDDKERTLNETMLMIQDLEGPVAIAGVMGGQNSEIDDDTTDVVLESAFFNPTNIRRTAKTLGMNTDASYRFERGVDIENVVGALQRATELILEHAGGEAKELVDLYPAPYQAPTVRVRYERVRAINGIHETDQTIRLMCAALGCEVKELDETSCEIVPPAWRVDIHSEIDIAEEVMRMHGINKVAAAEQATLNLGGLNLHESVQAAGGTEKLKRRALVREQLRARGYADCVTPVLTSPDTAKIGGKTPVELANALGQEFSALRTSIVPGLLAVASRNLRHGAATIRLADIGSVFNTDASTELGVKQEEHLCMLITGDREEHWSLSGRTLDLYDLFGDMDLLGNVNFGAPSELTDSVWTENTVSIESGKSIVGRAGQISPELAAAYDIEGPVYVAEITLRDVDSPMATYRAPGLYPTVRRDLALVVDEGTTAGQVIEVIERAAPKTFRGVKVFDVFRDDEHVGKGKKSLAVALTFRSDERTLVDEEVDKAMAEIIKVSEKKLGAHVRGSVHQGDGS